MTASQSQTTEGNTNCKPDVTASQSKRSSPSSRGRYWFVNRKVCRRRRSGALFFCRLYQAQAAVATGFCVFSKRGHFSVEETVARECKHRVAKMIGAYWLKICETNARRSKVAVAVALPIILGSPCHQRSQQRVVLCCFRV